MNYITTDELEKIFRSDVDDPLRGVAPDAPDVTCLWKSWEVMQYMNEAASEVARRTQRNHKTYTIPIVAADGPFYLLPSTTETIDISQAYLQVLQVELIEINMNQQSYPINDYGYMTSSFSHWQTATGNPRWFNREEQDGYIRLVPKPTKDDTLLITATVDSYNLDTGMTLPFNHYADRRLMLTWMKKLAYQKHDADTFDQARAEKFEVEFERMAIDRRYECERQRRAPGVVRFSW